jgi:hypothetical protein
MRSAGLCVLACIALFSPAAALAQKRTPTPSGEELWKTYPLHPTPRTHATPARGSSVAPASRGDRQRSGRSGSKVSREDRRSGASLLLAVVGPAALVLLWLRLRRRVRTSASAGDALVDEDRLRLGRRERSHLPPDAQHAWTAEIQWRRIGDASRFCVVAQGAPADEPQVLIESAPLARAPDEVAALPALIPVVDDLAESLVGAGWQPLTRTGDWYARRFRWTPVALATSLGPDADAAEPQRGQEAP